MSSTVKHGHGCDGGCSSCYAKLDSAQGPHGWRLVALAGAVFVLPLVLAATVASIMGRWGANASAGGACLGLAGGMAIVIFAARALGRMQARGRKGECPLAADNGSGEANVL